MQLFFLATGLWGRPNTDFRDDTGWGSTAAKAEYRDPSPFDYAQGQDDDVKRRCALGCDEGRTTAKATTKTNAGILRLRCSQSAVSNFAQDDVRLGLKKTGKSKDKDRATAGEGLPSHLRRKERAEDGAPMLLAWWRRTREMQGRVIGE